MKKGIRKSTAVLLALVLALLLGAGCRKNRTDLHGRLDTSLVNAAGERYAPISLALPDGWSMAVGGGAWQDPETGEILIPASDGDGNCAVFRFAADGGLLSKTDFPAEEGSSLLASAITRDGEEVWAALLVSDGIGTVLRRVRTADGQVVFERAFSELHELPPDFFVERMAADGDGDLWLAAGDTALVYTSSLAFLGDVKPGGRISSLAVDPAGRMWASAEIVENQDCGAFRLNKKTGGWEESIGLDPTNRNLAFSADGDLYYDTKEGVRALHWDDEGRVTVRPVMSFLASGIVWGEGGSLVSGEAGGDRSELMLASEDGLLFRAVEGEGRRIVCRPTLFRPAEEEDGDGVVTVQIAFAKDDGPKREKIVKFNAEHPDIQITLLDYSIYDESYYAGEQKLLLDMTTGIISPDIVVGGADSLVIMTLARQNRTVDLLPYFETEELLRPDNIFGMARRFFDNGEGGLWGFAASILPETWVSSREILGPYGSDEGWGVEEYLDFAESLPAGQYLCFMYGARGVNSMYLPGVFESFVDRETGTCTFDSPLFARYLRHLDALPTAQEISANRPACREQTELTRAGFYALYDARDGGAEDIFGTPDYVNVGYPSDNPAGRVKIYASSYVIPKTAPHPDEAWKVLRAFFLDQEARTAETSPLKSDFDEAWEASRDLIHLHFENGAWTHWPAPMSEYDEVADQIKALQDVMNPGLSYTVEPPDEEQHERKRRWLEEAGGRAIDLLPPEVNELIREEISAYLGGVGTAEECAKKIQSRVSIWLAENK